MKQTVTLNTFKEGFAQLGRANFTEPALELIFSYLEDLERETRVEEEFDLIGICGDFQEATFEQVVKDHGIPADKKSVVEFLDKMTTVVGTAVCGSVVFVQF